MESHVYEPKYVMWYEKDFAADTYVSRVMRSLHRHFYRALIIASCFNSLRPFLPNDDSQLWIFADAESLDQWIAHKDVVMHKFTLTQDGKHWQHKRILADWQMMLDAHQKNVEKGRKGGNTAGKGRPSGSAQAQPKPAQAQPNSDQAELGTVTELDLTILNLTELNTTQPNEIQKRDDTKDSQTEVREQPEEQKRQAGGGSSLKATPKTVEATATPKAARHRPVLSADEYDQEQVAKAVAELAADMAAAKKAEAKQ